MPDNTSNEEQEQIKQIIERWRKVDRRCALLMGCALVYCVVFMTKQRSHIHSFVDLLLFIGNVLFWGCVSIFIAQYFLKRFLRQLSANDLELLKQASVDNGTDAGSAQHILRTYTQCKIASPEKELLRASAKTEDETLLRAAAYTDATPQDQLLRPSQNPPAE